MRRVIAVAAAVAAIFIMVRGGMISASNTIEYRGTVIKLSRAYHDYDEFKNDENNLPPDEVVRVQELVRTAPIEQQFKTRLDIARAVSTVKFPGYGSGSYASTPQPDSTTLDLWGVEIPKAQSTRFFLFRLRDGTYTLIDDFAQQDGPSPMHVQVVDGRYVFQAQNGTPLFERPVR